MKKVFLLAMCVLTVSCARKAKNPPPAPTEITSDTVVKMQTGAQNSLNYIGMYSGKLPCADCAETEVSLQLSEGFSYTLTKKFLGKNSRTEEKRGRYSWNKAGNAIVLDNVTDGPNQYLVTENSLTQLYLNGEPIKGKLEKNYVLSKVPESKAAATDAPKPVAKVSLEKTKWKLVELGSKPVKDVNGKDVTIEFKDATSFSAYAGCNSIGGKYELSGDKIRFFNVMSTRMACKDMSVETGLVTTLESVNNFVHNGSVLQLRNGSRVFARFEPYIEMANR